MRVIFVFAALLLSGCRTKHPGTYEVMEAATATGDAAALQSEAAALWDQRVDKAKLTEAMKKYEAAYQADPRHRETAVRLTRGYYFLGDAFESDKDAKLAAWEQAITWGKRCMALNQEFTALLEKGDESEATAARVMTTDDVPCIYWTSSALGKWAKLSGLAKTLKHIGTVKAYMARVGELNPSFYYYGPDRYWGAYYAAIPSFAGRDLEKSQEHFDKSIGESPEYVGTKVLKAEYWAVNTQDKATFTLLLNEVLEANPADTPLIAPEVKMEQQKAKVLLARQSELFAD